MRRLWLAALLLFSLSAAGQSRNPYQEFQPGRNNYRARTAGGESCVGAAFCLRFDEYWDNFTGITGAAVSGFQAAAVDHAFDLGTQDFAIHFVATLPLSAPQFVFTTNPSEGNGWIGVFTVGIGNTLRLAVHSDDGTAVMDQDWDITGIPGDGLIHAFDIKFARNANAELLIDGASKGLVSAVAFIGKTVSANGKTGLMAENATTYPYLGTLWEFAFGLGVTTLGTVGPGSGISPYTYISDSTPGLLAHWKMQEASGNLTDSKGELVLVKSGAPTYSVAGAGKDVDIYDEVGGIKLSKYNGSNTPNIAITGSNATYTPGIQMNAVAGGFYRAVAATAALDFGTGSGNIFFVMRNDATPGTFAEIFITTIREAGMSGFSIRVPVALDSISIQLIATDATSVTATFNAASVATALQSVAFHRYEFRIDRSAGTVNLVLDDVLQTPVSIAALAGKLLNTDATSGIGVGCDWRAGINRNVPITLGFLRVKKTAT